MTNETTLPPKLKRFFTSGTKLDYSKGQIIIRPEDSPSGVFYIDEGFVKTYSIDKHGNDNLHLVRKNGEIFPFIWVFTDQHREVYYEALSNCVLYRVAKSDFKKLVDSDRDVMYYVLEQAIEMYRVHSERLYNIQFHTAEERVVYRLLVLAHRFGEKKQKNVVKINLPIRHSDIAASLRMSRETATRILSKLEKQGLIGYDKPYIVIMKRDKLEKLL